MANLSEVYFYHVTTWTVVSALPQLLSKAKDIGWTVFIRGKDEASLKFIDDAIWTVQPESFLPHAVLGSHNSEKSDILLGTEEDDSSNSDFLLSLNGALISTEEVAKYKRCALLFDDKNPDEVSIAREHWKKFTEADIQAKYWSQETGTWGLKQEN